MIHQDLLKEKISGLIRLPEHDWKDPILPYMRDDDGEPAVRLAGFQCPLDFDLWEGLRNPAGAGLYNAGLEEIFEYFASTRRSNVDEDGRASVFKVRRTWDWARENYGRAIVISAMLPLSEEASDRYNCHVKERRQAPWEGYSRVWQELNSLLDKGITRLSYDLLDDSRAVVVMNSRTVEAITDKVIPSSRKGNAHGYCKGDNYSQKSVAALTGLGQFGLHRLIMRDEGNRRMVGPIRSLVVFDPKTPESTAGDFPLMTPALRDSRREVNDLRNTDPAVDARRFCTWQSGCGLCLSYCPGKAIGNSSPGKDGNWPEAVKSRKNFFWEGELQFDGANCADERGQMGELYDEWMCGRCVSICAGAGQRKESAAL